MWISFSPTDAKSKSDLFSKFPGAMKARSMGGMTIHSAYVDIFVYIDHGYHPCKALSPEPSPAETPETSAPTEVATPAMSSEERNLGMGQHENQLSGPHPNTSHNCFFLKKTV